MHSTKSLEHSSIRKAENECESTVSVLRDHKAELCFPISSIIVLNLLSSSEGEVVFNHNLHKYEFHIDFKNADLDFISDNRNS